MTTARAANHGDSLHGFATRPIVTDLRPLWIGALSHLARSPRNSFEREHAVSKSLREESRKRLTRLDAAALSELNF